MKRILTILLLACSVFSYGQLAVGVGVGVPFGNSVKALSAAIITANPVNDTVSEAQSVTYSVVATGSPLLYQWQYSVDGTTYANLSDGGKYSGVTTKNLTISAVDYLYHKNYYRVIVLGGKLPSDTSSSALLYVNDSSAIKYFARMTTAPSDSFKLKVNDFVIAQKDSGLWAKKAVIVLLQAESAQAATLNMKGDVYNATFINSPTWAANDGLTADVGYVNSNFNTTTHGGTLVTQNSQGAAYYCKSNISKAAFDISADGGVGVPYFLMNSRSAINKLQNALNDGSSQQTIDNTNGIGIFQLNRNESSKYRVIKNTSTTDVSIASTGITNNNILIGQLRNGYLTTRKYGYYEICSGLTNAEIQTNYNQLKILLGYTP